jgi:hypothetical protein
MFESWLPMDSDIFGKNNCNASQFKKIEAVKDSLEKTDQLAFVRPDGDHLERPFVLEVCEAQRFAVPRSKESDKPALSFWLSAKQVGPKGRASHLCLLENFQHPDVPAINYWRTSAYSLLVSLVYYARAEIDRSAMSKFIGIDPPPNPYAKFGTDSHPYSLQEWQNAKDYLYEFIDNPVALLRKWGSEVSAPRRIETLYRVREWGPEAARSGADISIFGYPLWILSA